jgi:hypothetical protein
MWLQRIINSESEIVPGMKDPWQFDHKNLADKLHETLPQENGMKDYKVVSSFFPHLFDVHALMYDLQNWFIWKIFLSASVITNRFNSHHFCMQLMLPILDSGHWVLFVIDDLLGHVLIFDSNPYKLLGTDPYERHTMHRMMASRNTKWAPTLMKRLPKALHEVRPKVGIATFGKWALNVVESAPLIELGSNDGGFYVMRYIESYDPLGFSVADSIQQVCSMTRTVCRCFRPTTYQGEYPR